MSSLPPGCCDLIYVDPPFITNGRRVEGRESVVYFDESRCGGLPGYLEFLHERFAQMRRLLSPAGSLFVHLDWRSVHYVKVQLDELFGRENFLNEIIWSYRSGSRPARWFPRKHDTILFYARCAGRHTFHLQRGGEFRTRDMKRTPEGLPYKQTRSGRLYFHPSGPAVTDVWDVPFLSTVSSERTGYPSQKPEGLLDLVIKAGSNPGDVVGDFFCGSGTTLVVAKRLGRRTLGCDINPRAVRITKRRLGIDT